MFDSPLYLYQHFAAANANVRVRERLRHEAEQGLRRSQEHELAVAQDNAPGDSETSIVPSHQEKFDIEENFKGPKVQTDLNMGRGHNRRTVSSASKQYQLNKAGLSLLPRTAATPRVYSDTSQFVEFYKSRTGRMSTKAKLILGRTNFKLPYYIKYDYADDEWSPRGLRYRSIQMVSNIVHISLLRKDYDTAWRAYVLLVRSPYVEFRTIWGIGVELLAWRHTSGNVRSSDQDEQLLEWLLVNYAYADRTTRRVSHPKVVEYSRILLTTMIRKGKLQPALEKLEDVIHSPPYVDDPTSFALYGILNFLLREQGTYRLANARKNYDKCVQLGGFIPPVLYEELEKETGNISGSSGEDSD